MFIDENENSKSKVPRDKYGQFHSGLTKEEQEKRKDKEYLEKFNLTPEKRDILKSNIENAKCENAISNEAPKKMNPKLSGNIENLFTKKTKNKKVLGTMKKRFFDEKQAEKFDNEINAKVLESIEFLGELEEEEQDEKNIPLSPAQMRVVDKAQGKRTKLLVTPQEEEQDAQTLEAIIKKHERRLRTHARREQALRTLNNDKPINEKHYGREFLNNFNITVMLLQEAFSKGLNVTQASRHANISSATYYNIIKKFPSVKVLCDQASNDLQIKCIETVNQGAELDPDLALKLLERLDPEKWGKEKKQKEQKENTSKKIVNNILVQLQEKPESVLSVMKEALSQKPQPKGLLE